MNHLKAEGTEPDNLFNQAARGSAVYPSVEGLPKYLHTNQLQYIQKNVIKSMLSHRQASPFLKPVEKKHYKDYYDIIKKPVDLSYIKKKLINKHYQSAQDCIADFDQMFENCEIYNKDKDDPQILSMNAELKKYFISKLAKMPSKEQPLAAKSKSTKKNPRTSFSGSINGSSYDHSSDEDDEDVASHRSGIDEHTNSPPAFNFDQESVDSEAKKSLKRKIGAMSGNASPNKVKGSASRQVPKRSSKEFRLPENISQDVDIGEAPPNISRELGYCFEILKEFYRRPLSVRTNKYYQIENKTNAEDTDEDAIARRQLFMDLNTVLKKFQQKEYQDPDEFASDMRKTFTYIYRFSKHSPSLIKETQDIQNIFEMKIAHIPYTRNKQQSSFNIKIDSLIKVVKNIGFQLESLKDKEPPTKRRKIFNENPSTSYTPEPQNDRTKPKMKPKATPITSHHHQPPTNQSPAPPKPNPAPQKPSVKEIPNEFKMFFRPNSVEPEMSPLELLGLSYVLSQNLNKDQLSFILEMTHYAGEVPQHNQSTEYTLDLENLKANTLRAIERYAIHCIGSELYKQVVEQAERQYKIPQLPAKTSSAPKSLQQHNKNSSIESHQPADANTSSSSSSSSSSSASSSGSQSSSSSSSSSHISSPETNRQAATTLTSSTNTKPSLQQLPTDHVRSLNGESKKAVQNASKQGTPNPAMTTPKSSDSSKAANKVTGQEMLQKLPTSIDQKSENMQVNNTRLSSPDLANRNSDLSNDRLQSKGSGTPCLNEMAVPLTEENKTEGGNRFPAWGSMLQKSLAPQKPTINPDETFFKFKKQAEEKMEREKLNKQQEQERRHRMEVENDERLKKEKELKHTQDEEEVPFSSLGKSKPTEPQPCSSRSTPSSVPPPTNSHPTSPKNDNQQPVLSPSERRLIEQQRRKNAARACQIDLNAQSEIFAAFERDLHGQSLMNH